MNLKNGESVLSMKELFDDVPALIAVVKGKEHIFEYANKLYKKSIKQSAEIIGLPLRTALPELEGQGIYEILDAVYTTGKPFEINEMCLRIDVMGDGEIKDMFFNLIYKPLRDDQNNVTGIFAHAVDISGLVKTRIAAEKRKEQLEDMILNAPVATALYVGKDMVVKLANEKMISLWGKDRSVINKKLKDALPELKGQPFIKLLEDVFTTGVTYHANEQKAILEVDGNLVLFWFNFTYQPLLDKYGNVYGILNMALDVSYQVEAKNKLAKAEEKLRNAIEVAKLGTWEYDLVTGKIEMNKQLMEWRGITKTENYTIKDALATTIESEDLWQKLQAAMQIDSNGIVNNQYNIINPLTNEIKHFHSIGKTYFSNENKPEFMAGITYDKTAQHLSEIEMEKKIEIKTAELEDANNDLLHLNANLEQFVYVASHDLQEPLRKINIFSDMLLKSSAALNEDDKMYISKIEKAAKRMSLLINDLLEFSRIRSSETMFKPTDLNKIIADIQIDYELLINQKNANIILSSLPVIEAIPLQMNQLFYNLIGNALKFSKEDTAVEIKINCEMVDKNEKGFLKLNKNYSYCKISVEDNGIGFDQKYASLIFEIFQRLHGKQEYAGTGIGLSLAKKIVDNHGGNISAVSVENEGSIFSVILPVIRNDQ